MIELDDRGCIGLVEQCEAGFVSSDVVICYNHVIYVIFMSYLCHYHVIFMSFQLSWDALNHTTNHAATRRCAECGSAPPVTTTLPHTETRDGDAAIAICKCYSHVFHRTQPTNKCSSMVNDTVNCFFLLYKR